jgi:hypothetical protein
MTKAAERGRQALVGQDFSPAAFNRLTGIKQMFYTCV